ncbi:kinase-like domain-containing protein [Mycena epipterygia]|nr:kinase-like domain-containing protein [Mycena epipterygia]
MANPLRKFLEFLRNDSSTGSATLFAWDDADAIYLAQLLGLPSSVYPNSWRQYMVEVSLQDWRLIRNLTWTTSRTRRGLDQVTDLAIRLAALFLTHSSTFIAPETILAPLGISFANSIFPSIARVMSGNQTDHPPPDFWVRPKLKGWLLDRSEALCHATLQNTPGCNRTVLRRVEYIYLFLTMLPKNLVLRTQRFDGESVVATEISMAPTYYIVERLKRYCSVETLKRSYMSEDSHTSHIISKEIYVHMSHDIAVVAVQLVFYLRDSESYKRFLAYRGIDAQHLLDLLQELLDHDTVSEVRPVLFKALLRLSRVSGLHPRCFALPGLQTIGQQMAAGGFGDIWKGQIHDQRVSVKIMRLFHDADVEAVLKEFGREALIWRQLCHPNLLPFFGLYYLNKRLCLVSPWMENGNILQFLSKESNNTDRLSLILDVALGLEYLHENQIVHGDLKAINILVTPSHRACIADFGLSSIADAMTVRFTHSTVSSRGGTARYLAPELFRGGSKIHFGSDVYAFACVGYEILTGKVPFYELPNDMAVMFQVAAGKRPSQPSSCSGTAALDSLWELLQDCWKDDPELRPSAIQIVERLKSPLIQATTTQSMTDWDAKFGCKFRRSVEIQSLSLPSVPQIEREIFGDEVAKACKECFPENTKSLGGLERRPKRLFEEEPSDGDTDSKGRHSTKKTRPSHVESR